MFLLALESNQQSDEVYRCRGRDGYSRLIEFARVFRSRHLAKKARRPGEYILALQPGFFRQLRFHGRNRRHRERLKMSWS